MTKAWTPISRLMAADRPQKAVVARGPKGDYAWHDFQNHVAGLCQQLAKQPKGRWLLSCESTYAFSVGLFALWHTGRIVVLPPNQQSESLRESAQGVRGLISDGSSAIFKGPVLSPLAQSKKAGRWNALNVSRTALELFTSGSTGKRRPVKKTLAQLERELAVLEKTFGARLGACDVHATVSHQHIYGLLFRLLWPLCAGRPFAEDTLLFWEELSPRLAASKAAVLVASPAHLERLTPAGEAVLQKKSVRAIFSSGGPLREAAAERIRALAHQSPIEVFGSTETGGVGWRCGPEELWQPLEGVVVAVRSVRVPSPTRGEGAKLQQHLKVKSPFGPSKKWMMMGDRGAVFSDGRFSLAGRADRIVKLAEKRLSLDDMQRRLHQHPWVAAARVILLDSEDAGSRTSLGAVVALNSGGHAQLARASHAGLTAGLRAHLQKSFDASTLPRAFRFVATLPIDAMGKVSQAVLTPLFRAASQALTLAQVLETMQDEVQLVQRLKVPQELFYLEGHFPDYPIVAGVVQLQWVIEAAASWLGARPVIRRMEAVKFKTPLFPGQEFSLVVERLTSGSETLLQFSLMDGETLYSSGRLVSA